MSELTLPERVLGRRLQEFDEVSEEQIQRQMRILKMMGEIGLLDNVVIGPWLSPDNVA